MEFPKFWYESNACWGNVTSLADLKEKLTLQLAESNGINTVDDFLDKSKQSSFNKLNFGTRSEHKESYTLRQLLKDNNLLDQFLKIV